MTLHRVRRLIACIGIFAAPLATVRADQIHITNFAKDSNIYTNLNEQFPHSGTGTPGSGVGTANASYLYDPATYTSPNMLSGSDLAKNNPTTFQIVSNSTGQDFASLTINQFSAPSSITIPINISGVTEVYSLMTAYFGTTFNVTFTGANGATETFSNVSNPDFNGGAGSVGINKSYDVNGSATTNLYDQTVLIVHNVGAGGTGNSTTGQLNDYNLTQQTYILDSQLAGQELVSATFTTNGNTTLLLGLTVNAASVPEPSTLALGAIAATALVVLDRSRRKARTTR